MLPTLSEQTVYFFASVVFGAALSALYGLVRLIRVLVDRNFFDVISDILFFIAAGVLTSLFALPFNKGDVRGFIVLGEAIGFLSVHLTLGAMFARAFGAVIMALRKFTQKIFKIVKKLFQKVLNFMHFILYNINVIKDRVHRSVSKKKPKSKVRKESYEQKRKDKKAPA